MVERSICAIVEDTLMCGSGEAATGVGVVEVLLAGVQANLLGRDAVFFEECGVDSEFMQETLIDESLTASLERSARSGGPSSAARRARRAGSAAAA